MAGCSERRLAIRGESGIRCRGVRVSPIKEMCRNRSILG